MLEFRKDNPSRPVDWRWQRAQQLIKRRQDIDRFVDDEPVREARAFCAAIGRRPNEDQLIRLADNYPDLYQAWRFSEQTEHELSHFEIEARLLASEPSESIALKCATTPGAVDYYESWFFNVRDRLNCPGYITNVVIGPAIHHGLSERDFDLLWKLFGYWGGAHVLDSIIYLGHSSTRPAKPEETAAFWADDIKQQLRMKTAITVRTMPCAFDQQTIFETYLRCLELEKNAGVGGATEIILTNIDAFMKQLPWSAGEEQKLVSKEIDKFDKLGVGLRSSELLMLGTGQQLPGLLEMAETLKFPEPGSNTKADPSP